jgi:hypothetical protein
MNEEVNNEVGANVEWQLLLLWRIIYRFACLKSQPASWPFQLMYPHTSQGCWRDALIGNLLSNFSPASSRMSLHGIEVSIEDDNDVVQLQDGDEVIVRIGVPPRT